MKDLSYALSAPTNPPANFDVLFSAHWPMVVAVLDRLLGDADEAEDLALETFVRLYDHLERWPDFPASGGWLYRVATHLGFNALRARLRRRRYEELAGKAGLDNPDGPNPANAVEQAEERQQVRQILAEMRPHLAQLLFLRSAGLSYRELGEVCQLAPGSIGKYLNRAEQEFEQRYRARYGSRG